MASDPTRTLRASLYSLLATGAMIAAFALLTVHGGTIETADELFAPSLGDAATRSALAHVEPIDPEPAS